MQISSADLFSTHGRTCHINEKSTITLPTAPASHHQEGQRKLEQIMPWWRDHSTLSLPVLRQQVIEERVCFLPFLVLLPFPRKKTKNVRNKRQAARAKEGRKPFEVKRMEFQLFNDFMTIVSLKCWSPSGYSKSPQFHTPVTPQSCTEEFSNLDHIYMTELHYFYIVNTSI